MAGRNPLLLLTAALLAATLEVALPNLQVEVPGAEGESLQGEALASPRPTRHETAGGSISSASVISPSDGTPQERDRAVQHLQVRS